MIDSWSRMFVILLGFPVVGAALFWLGRHLEKKYPEFPMMWFACSTGFLGFSVFCWLRLILGEFGWVYSLGLGTSLWLEMGADRIGPKAGMVGALVLNFLFGWCLPRGFLPLLLKTSENVYGAAPVVGILGYMRSKIVFLRSHMFIFFLILLVLWPVVLVHSFFPKRLRSPAAKENEGRFWRYGFFTGLVANGLVCFLLVVSSSPIDGRATVIQQLVYLGILWGATTAAVTAGALAGEMAG